MKAVDYGAHNKADFAFVATNSICQGQHVPTLWPLVLGKGYEITFAHTSFKWANLASYNAGVTVAVIGISVDPPKMRRLFSLSEGGNTTIKEVTNINPYLAAGENIIVDKVSRPISDLREMSYGNYPGDGNYLTISSIEARELAARHPRLQAIVRPIYGAQEFIKGLSRFCLWIDDSMLDLALTDPFVADRVASVRATRTSSRDVSLNKLAKRSH